MSKILWRASHNEIINSNIYGFEKYLKKKFNFKIEKNFRKLLKWSIKNPGNFWSSVWDYSKIVGKKNPKTKLSKNLLKSKFLINSKLNFAENLLRKNDNTKAITFISENGYRTIMNCNSDAGQTVFHIHIHMLAGRRLKWPPG